MIEETNNPTDENARTVEGEMSEAEIDSNLEETFPASDPPSWTLGTNHREETRGEQDDDAAGHTSDDEPQHRP